MSLPCPVPTCARDMPGSATICGACEAELRRALAAVRWLPRELDVTLAKQHTREGGGSTEIEDDPNPAVLHIGTLGFDPGASEAAWVLRSTLRGWVRVISENWTAPIGPVCRRRCAHDSCIAATGYQDTLPSMARWLSALLPRLVKHAAADEAHGEIVAAVRDAQRVVDRPPEREFAGRCPGCGAALYAEPGASAVQCREEGCEAEPVDVDDQWDAMLDQITDRLVTATQAADILTRLAAPLKAELVRQWAARGRLIAHGHDPAGHPLYRVADVRELLVEKLGREQRAQQKREAKKRERMAS